MGVRFLDDQDSGKPTSGGKVRFLDEEKPSMLGKIASRYAAFMGPEGAYGGNPAGKAYSMVQTPFKKVGEMIAEQSGKRGLPPQVGAGIGTAVEMIPDIAMTFGTGPERPSKPNFISKLGKGLAAQAESASGAMPGSLEAAYNDASLIRSPGREAAKPFYKAAEQENIGKNIWKGATDAEGNLVMEPGGQNMFKKNFENLRIVKRAQTAIDSGRILEPSEAQTARKAVDALKNNRSYSKDALIDLRTKLDEMAKGSENIATADPIHKRGMMAESLRNFLPQNKYGGASAFKMGIAPALTGLGGFVGGPPGAAIGGGIAAAALSPVVQGGIATAAGLIDRYGVQAIMSNPQLSYLVSSLLRQNRKNEDSNPQ